MLTAEGKKIEIRKDCKRESDLRIRIVPKISSVERMVDQRKP